MISLLTALALVLAGSLTVYYAVVGFLLRWIGIRQTADEDTDGIDREADQQQQDDDYQTLISLGFEPIGQYREQIGFLDAVPDEITMIHSELPICCSLKMLHWGTVVTELISDDNNGSFIVTTTREAPQLAADEQDFFLQSRWGEQPESLFQAHVVALNAREAEGFSAATIKDMSGYVDLRKRYFQHRKIQSFLTGGFFTQSLFCATITLFFPALFGSIACILGIPFQLQAEVGLTCFACFSIYLSSVLLHKSLQQRNKNEAERLTVDPKDSTAPFKTPTSLHSSQHPIISHAHCDSATVGQ